MRLLIKIILLALLPAAALFSAPGLDAANKLYESGKYSEAAAAYAAEISAGNACAEARFNLGNANFKDKKIGLAILNYEKALAISPRDADIKYNLEFARNFVKDNAVEDSAGRFLNAVYRFLTLNELCALLAGAFFLLMGSLVFRLYRKDELSYWLAFGAAILFTLILLLSGTRILDFENNTPAIVVALSVEAKPAPLDSTPASFTLPEGKKVYILNARQGWAEVLLKGENIKGWVKQDSIAEIR